MNSKNAYTLTLGLLLFLHTVIAAPTSLHFRRRSTTIPLPPSPHHPTAPNHRHIPGPPPSSTMTAPQSSICDVSIASTRYTTVSDFMKMNGLSAFHILPILHASRAALPFLFIDRPSSSIGTDILGLRVLFFHCSCKLVFAFLFSLNFGFLSNCRVKLLFCFSFFPRFGFSVIGVFRLSALEIFAIWVSMVMTTTSMMRTQIPKKERRHRFSNYLEFLRF